MFQVPIQDFLSHAWKPNVHPQRYIFILVTDMVDKSVCYLRFFCLVTKRTNIPLGIIWQWFSINAHFAVQWM